MATTAQVVKASLQRIIVQESEQPIEASDAQDFIFAMNNYMLALDASGVSLGYTEVTNLGDQVTIPTGALRGLIANMAIEIAPDYDAFISPALAEAARQGLGAMRKLGQRQGTSRYPSTLPIGGGNERDNFFNRHFFPDLEAEILAETTGAIGLEVNTNDVA